MKAIFAIAVITMFAYSSANTCTVTSFCMGCTTGSVCSSCFNWGSGKVGARSLATNTCTAALTRTATDVKFYNGTHTNTSTWASGVAACKKNDFVVDSTVANPKAASCTKTWPAGSTKIANCKYGGADKTSTTASTATCTICDKGKGGNTGSTACTGTVITNCDYAAGLNCYYCKSKFAVASTGTTCSAFTTDGNCRTLSAAATCATCWDAYYFNATTCKLFAKVLAAGFALAISAFLF